LLSPIENHIVLVAVKEKPPHFLLYTHLEHF